jgi:hypothetical protein
MTTTKTTAKKSQKFDYKTIKTFEDACQKLGLDPANLPRGTIDEFEKPVIALFKLLIVFKAINNGWRPDWNNSNQYKYYPWFGVFSSGFGFSLSHYICTYTGASVGSRLCTDTSEKALYMAEQFKDLYQDYLLYSE